MLLSIPSITPVPWWGGRGIVGGEIALTSKWKIKPVYLNIAVIWNVAFMLCLSVFFFVSCFYCNTECSLWIQHSFRLLIALPSVTITYSNVKLCTWHFYYLHYIYFNTKVCHPFFLSHLGFIHLFIYLSNRVFVPLIGLKSSGWLLIAKSIF